MKQATIVLGKTIALTLWVLLNSGFLAIAAEPELMPAPPPPAVSELTLSEEENSDIERAIAQGETVEKTSKQISLAQAGTMSSDEQVPVGVIVNGITRDEGMTLYLPSGATTDQVLLPLRDISELMSLAITVNAGNKTAEGFFGGEENNFRLDLNSGELVVAGEARKIKPDEAVVQDGDIYVRINSFRDWFGFDVTFDISELELIINTGSDLPFQERMKRLMNAKKNQRTYTYDAIKPEEATMAPYKNFSLPSLYTTSFTGLQQSGGDSSLIATATLQGYQDIAKFEADYTIAGQFQGEDGRKITGARATLSKRDPLNKLLGPMKAGRVSFGDVTFPSVPLLGSGGSGTGIEISSDSTLGTRYASNSENFLLEGDAPVGYDAELYRNGIFLAFQQVGPDGRYRFENLELPSGYNTFEVILYGPQGQKTTIKRDVTRGSRQLRKGELEYDMAAGAPKADFLPFAETARKTRDPGASAQVFYGFTNFFTMGMSAFHGPQDAPRDIDSTLFPSSTSRDQDEFVNSTGATVSTALSFMGIDLQGQVLGADKGRSAYDASVSTRMLGTNVGVAHTIYKNFLEDDQELKERSELYVGRAFGGFNTSFRFQNRTYLEREKEFSIENTVSYNFKGLRVTNDIERVYSKDENYDEFTGELAALATAYGIRFRGALQYDLEPDALNRYQRFTFSGQKRLTGRSSLRFEGAHEFETELDSLSVRYSHDFDKFGLDLDATGTTDNNYIFTVGLRTALQPDKDNNYHFVDPVGGGQAAIGVRAFLDKNENDLFDAGDEALEGVEFRSSTGSNREATNKEGLTYLTNLGETPLRLSVVTESLSDIYLSPKFDHKDMIPRRGSTPVIDFPFVKMSEIAGYLQHLKQGVEGAIVRLLSVTDGKLVEETQTDEDGYFIFPAVKGGHYKIAFGTKAQEFMSLNYELDTTIDDPAELMVEADGETVKAVKAAQEEIMAPRSEAGEDNIRRMNAPAGDLPNIDDPIDEKDLKPLDEKDIESIIQP